MALRTPLEVWSRVSDEKSAVDMLRLWAMPSNMHQASSRAKLSDWDQAIVLPVKLAAAAGLIL